MTRTLTRPHPTLAAICTPIIAATAAAGAPDPSTPTDLSLTPALLAPLTLNLSLTDEPKDTIKEAKAPSKYGQSDGGWWGSVGTGAAWNFDKDYDFNLNLAATTFLAKDLEFTLELSGWYFQQTGPNTGGINPSMVFRYHFLHDEDYTYTIYADAGIGLLFAFDEVPTGGTRFNFTPRAGVGATFKLGESENRLQVGIRYHHISNARIDGDSRNPSRDSIMLYAGLIFPF